MLFVRAYPRETQEMVFDAHDRAFVLFKGACRRGIYDNMKTAVETIFVGKQRGFRQFLLRGVKKVRAEWAMICTTHNLLKLFTLAKAA